MCHYIYIEDLAANALINYLEENQEKRFLNYREVEDYGNAIIKYLDEKKKDAVLVLSRDATYEMYRNYCSYFEEKEIDNRKGIALKPDVEVDDLIKKFRGYLAADVLLAFLRVKPTEVIVN